MKKVLEMDDSTRLRKIEYLLGTLLSLVIADGLITQYLIRSGLGNEANPFLKILVAQSDFLIIKMCGAIFCALLLWNMAKRSSRLIFTFSSCLVAIYTTILLWNISVYLFFRA